LLSKRPQYLNRFSERGKFVQAVIAGTGFLAVMLALQWPFGNFLNAPLARNWVFDMNYFGYFMRPSDYHLAWEFTTTRKRAANSGSEWASPCWLR
jgi:hypothetical protein